LEAFQQISWIAPIGLIKNDARTQALRLASGSQKPPEANQVDCRRARHCFRRLFGYRNFT